jgi:phosphoglucosamine mutase
MSQHGCRIGGEESGHIIFSQYATTGDGILTSLKMMEVMMARKKKLSELVQDLVMYPHVLRNVRVLDKKTVLGDPQVQSAIEKVKDTLGDTGRILVRESGTEPVIRVMVEAKDEDLCRQYVQDVMDVIHSQGYAVEK